MSWIPKHSKKISYGWHKPLVIKFAFEGFINGVSKVFWWLQTKTLFKNTYSLTQKEADLRFQNIFWKEIAVVYGARIPARENGLSKIFSLSRALMQCMVTIAKYWKNCFSAVSVKLRFPNIPKRSAMRKHCQTAFLIFLN